METPRCLRNVRCVARLHRIERDLSILECKPLKMVAFQRSVAKFCMGVCIFFYGIFYSIAYPSSSFIKMLDAVDGSVVAVSTKRLSARKLTRSKAERQ